ncbi:galectin-1-like [Elgaria multicarinata webbii]|uniref:galectin-1-like n=1 Tax=Elgaria multicarinata webbii TaxID=159646 RepID=UPI002FCD4D06
MAVQLVAEFKVRTGECIKVKGKPTLDAKSFAINLGRDELGLILHFNPRFHGNSGTIIYNSKTCGKWDKQLQESKFPFSRGVETKIHITFNAKDVTVKLHNDQEIKFPNRLKLETVNYLSIVGDFNVKNVKFESCPLSRI